MSSRAAVFVDRDGVINELVPDPRVGASESPLRVADVRLVDGAGLALARLAQAGWALVGVSNQPAAAKGSITLAELDAIQARVVRLLGTQGVSFDDFRVCLHHPDATVPELRGPCECRKPAPGMLLQAAAALSIDRARSWMVGDTDADIVAGRAAGCATILIENPGSAHKRSPGHQADHLATDISEAANLILRRKE